MASKKMYYAATFIGSIVGGYISSLWGAGFLSLWSVLFSTGGALVGFFIVWKYL